MIKTVIVDDEPKARSVLKTLIGDYCDTLEVVGSADNVLNAIKLINQTNPSLVFLDIKMPEYNGFKLLEYVEKADFDVIFTTAYDEYAMKAQKANAAGYLLKPIDIDELIAVVDKVKNFSKNQLKESEIDWSKHIKVNHKKNTLMLPKLGGILNLPFHEILYIKSKGRDSLIHCKDKKVFTSNISLKNIEAILEKTSFLRIHKSIVANLMHMKRFSKGKESYIMLYNDEMLDVGKTFKDKLNAVTALFPR